jgi:GNAT superfamily N-acetyltransferase
MNHETRVAPGRIVARIADLVLRRCRVTLLVAAHGESADDFSGDLEFLPAGFEEFTSARGAGNHLDAAAIRRARDRIAAGDAAFIARWQGQCAGYGWARTQGMLDIAEVGVRAPLPDDAVVLYDFVIYPGFRRRGIYAGFLRYLRARYRAHRCLIYAESDNAASLAGIRSAGFLPWKQFSSWRVFGSHLAIRERVSG